VLAAFLLLSGVVYLSVRLYRYDLKAGFWTTFFLVALLPVSQVIPLVTMMNDRYLYFPLVAVAALAGYGINFLDGQGVKLRIRMIIVTLPLFFLAVVSFQRCGAWRDTITLWQDAVRKNQGIALAWESLGEAYHHAGRPDRETARNAYLAALKISPASELIRYNLGTLYLEQNDLANADKILRELLQISPQNVMGLTVFGDVALRQLDYAEAEKRYRKAMELQPEAVQIHRKLGSLLVVTGRLEEAKGEYLQIEELQGGSDPLNAYELALLGAVAGNAAESLKWLELALRRGYSDYAAIMNFEELAPIRADARFVKLMNEYFPKSQ
jgi:Flp pilus assembly protein TadD